MSNIFYCEKNQLRNNGWSGDGCPRGVVGRDFRTLRLNTAVRFSFAMNSMQPWPLCIEDGECTVRCWDWTLTWKLHCHSSLIGSRLFPTNFGWPRFWKTSKNQFLLHKNCSFPTVCNKRRQKEMVSYRIPWIYSWFPIEPQKSSKVCHGNIFFKCRENQKK